MTLFILAAALSLTVAAVSLSALHKIRLRLRQTEDALTQVEVAVARLQASATVKKTQEIVPSRYSHDRTSTTIVTVSPLTRSIYL